MSKFELASKAEQLDQYFTDPTVAAQCWQIVVNYIGADIAGWQFMEPSAGQGAFSLIMPKGTIAIDIDPQHPSISKGDFLTNPLPSCCRLAIVGNPPFGHNASSAFDFLNRAAKSAQLIGMILPRSFCGATFRNRIDKRFHLVAEFFPPKNSFTFEGKKVDIATVFQIWERRDVDRCTIETKTTSPDFAFLSFKEARQAEKEGKAKQADFAIWRVGVKAGQVHHNLSMSKSSHYFIRVIDKSIDVEAIMRQLPYEDVVFNTVSIPSYPKSELIRLYNDYKIGIPSTIV